MNGELYLKDILHLVSQDLLIPVMIVLAALIVYAVFCVGSLVVEVIMERRHYRENVPRFVNAVYEAGYSEVDDVIGQSGMLKHQKQALLTVSRNMGLPQTDLYALAKREVAGLDERYRRIAGRTDFASKVAPMFGLMGTLIPLGPGIVAMGQGDIDALSTSLLIAFDTTVAGLVAAAICLFVSRIRKAWYGKYLSAVEATVTAVLEKADEAREAGVKLPHGYEAPAKRGDPARTDEEGLSNAGGPLPAQMGTTHRIPVSSQASSAMAGDATAATE